MVERHDNFQAKEMMWGKIKLLNNSQSRILMLLLPDDAGSFPCRSVAYIGKVCGIQHDYCSEVLDVLSESGIVCQDSGTEEWYMTNDSLYHLFDLFSRQSLIGLYKKVYKIINDKDII